MFPGGELGRSQSPQICLMEADELSKTTQRKLSSRGVEGATWSGTVGWEEPRTTACVI